MVRSGQPPNRIGGVVPSFEPNSLLAMLLVSCVGFVLFRYGRRQRRFPQTTAGVLMLVYPTFVSDVTLMLLLCAALLVLVWVAVRMGL
jgi:UPF0716 family protein affecting phage T7 exclusion